ncbi:dTDP-4-amino-4,6-dideoxygalactose transaminase [Lewinella sp. LCG006]|uniref:dTDP-4-amino-4,6-dideoxygalactose transaminase n=1 Tax=Lewinella sp. LCG006 TaxID=3231911 RepID=UPI003460BF37
MKQSNEHIPFNRPLELKPRPDFALEANEWSQSSATCETVLTAANKQAFLTPSCTASLEMAALVCGLQPGDEVILPSFTHPSTANAFALRGCRLCFVDIDPATMNIDPQQIAAALSERTKAVVITHYAGIACDLDAIQNLLQGTNISLIEDAAHCIGAQFRGQPLGTFGRMGALSFHHTKNIHCGEGGAIWINHLGDVSKAQIIREKGTNRTAFSRGDVDFYHWVELGSSFTLSPLCAAYLLPQLEQLQVINQHRVGVWQAYYAQLTPLVNQFEISLPQVPLHCEHNGHIFYLLCRTNKERSALQAFLREKGIETAFHYLPLHSAPAGRRYGELRGADNYSTDCSERLLRLPLYYDLSRNEIERVVASINTFYHAK